MRRKIEKMTGGKEDKPSFQPRPWRYQQERQSPQDASDPPGAYGRMGVCVYVCMCVCEYECMCVCVYGCMCACVHVCMCVCVHVCMSVGRELHDNMCMGVWVYVCMCVCV